VPARQFVIVGAGLAGATAASVLRREGFDGGITIIGDEPHLPYSRPPLSKEVLRSEKPPEKAMLRPAQWYEAQGVETRCGVRVIAMDPGSHSVELADGGHLGYDKLLLALGGSPRRLDVPGSHRPEVFTLRTLDDSLKIREFLIPGAPVVVVGAGFIGAEVSASARTLGCEVTLLEIAATPMARALAPGLGAVYASLHRERGVKLHTGVGVERIEGDPHVKRVVTTDGRTHDAVVVVVGVGIDPAIELAEQCGVHTGNGVHVDEYCATTADDIYAAGDLANHPNSILGRRIRVEHWQNAQHQATAAACNMLGKREPFREVPWVWSDQYEHNLQIAGVPDPTDAVVIRGDIEGREFTAFCLREDRLVAALAVNRPMDARAARALIEQKVTPRTELLTDVDVELEALIADRTS
jgi:3-phenylpropionate/trans-cinnamate dioxygenase ferredoxin reductase subunit